MDGCAATAWCNARGMPPIRSIGRRAQFWRSPADQPRWARPTLLVLAACSAVLYGWRSGTYLEGYYAAAVRSMSMSWHNFVFAAFDPAGTITLDKLPGAFWVQALSVRIFGLHTWAIVAPQVVEGVLTVLVFYRVVRRLCGAQVAILAAGVLTVSPAVVTLDRGNISDTLMILLLVLAADATASAVIDGRLVSMVLAGVWVGLAFQAKMIEAWMVLPALALVLVVAAPGRLRRRMSGAVVVAVVASVVSLSWMTAITLVPSPSRPYVDGSQHDSVFAQVFVYNGIGRVDQETPNQLLSQSLGLVIPPPPPPSWHRLLTGSLGRDIGWLLPAAAASGVAALVVTRRRDRRDRQRAHVLIWGVWLVALATVFSVGSSLNPYYVAALAPPVAALVASGAQLAWRRRDRPSTRLVVAVTLVGTVVYGVALVPAVGTGLPGWLVPVVIVLGALALVGTVVSTARPRGDRRARGILLAVVSVCLLAPTVASVSAVTARLGPFDTPFQPPKVTVAVRQFFGVLDATRVLIPKLEQARNGAPFLMATQTSALAAPFIYDTGEEVLPIGGYTGTIPSPTLVRLQALVRSDAFHLVIQAHGATDPRLRWIVRTCLALPPASGPGVPKSTDYALFYCRSGT